MIWPFYEVQNFFEWSVFVLSLDNHKLSTRQKQINVLYGT